MDNDLNASGFFKTVWAVGILCQIPEEDKLENCNLVTRLANILDVSEYEILMALFSEVGINFGEVKHLEHILVTRGAEKCYRLLPLDVKILARALLERTLPLAA